VFKRVGPRSLEHDRSLDLVPWIAEFSTTVPQVGFRLPRPVQLPDGRWITADGWTAWTHVAGRHATRTDVPECIGGIVALHQALQTVPLHPLLRCNESTFGRADTACWGEKPDQVHPEVEPLVDALYASRRPVTGLQDQLIHGDLNPENILIAPGLPPAFLDLAPFWRPPEFALALFANWIGPRLGDQTVLRHFSAVRHFNQLLICAGIRMLLIRMTDPAGFAASPVARAARMILDHVGGDQPRSPATG
jgi:hypothetical protein